MTIVRARVVLFALATMFISCQREDNTKLNGGSIDITALRTAPVVRIGYLRKNNLKDYIELFPSKELLGTIEVIKQEKGSQAKLIEFCTVDFRQHGGPWIETKFIKPDQLEVLRWGQLYLRDSRFYEQICELISKKEGKAVDPLTGTLTR